MDGTKNLAPRPYVSSSLVFVLVTAGRGRTRTNFRTRSKLWPDESFLRPVSWFTSPRMCPASKGFFLQEHSGDAVDWNSDAVKEILDIRHANGLTTLETHREFLKRGIHVHYNTVRMHLDTLDAKAHQPESTAVCFTVVSVPMLLRNVERKIMASGSVFSN